MNKFTDGIILDDIYIYMRERERERERKSR
jgi:hypothetical protein